MDSIKETFDYLAEHETALSLTQIDFIKSLRKYFRRNKKLSEKQQGVLFEIRKYMNNEN